jgi:hypothetical protein
MLVQAIRAAVYITVRIEQLLKLAVYIDAEGIILLICRKIEYAIDEVSVKVAALEGKDISAPVISIYPAE